MLRPQVQEELSKPVRMTLDRLLSKLGIASRTTAQTWIRTGRVGVNGRPVHNPDLWISWPGDAVTLDKRPLRAPTKRLVLFHKPKGLVTTHRDERGRRTIFDALPPAFHALHTVGRLDQATSGLLLLTNDTALSSALTNPAHAVPRVYLVTVKGNVTDETAQRGIHGVKDKEGLLCCHQISVQKRSGRESHLEVTLIQGRNREIRRLFTALGHEVTRLRRIRFGPFKLIDLRPGQWKEIRTVDLQTLLVVAGG